MAWKTRTYAQIAIGAAVLAGLGFMVFRPDPVPVDLHIINRGPMEITITADGVTRIKDIFEVSSPITGTALRSPVAVGDAVVAGETRVATVQPLAPGLLDSRSLLQAQASVQEAQAAVHVAETELARAQEDQRLAQSQFERTRTLVERDVASLTRLEDAAQRLAVANAAVEASQARIDMAQSTLERARTLLQAPQTLESEAESCCLDIMAPASGVVLSVTSISERPVNIGAPLLSIGDPNQLEIVADLLSRDAVRIAPGTLARVDRWGGDATLMARLNRIAPTAQTQVSALGIEEQRIDAVFDIISDPAEHSGLGDGFAVLLHIIAWQNDDVLQVPLSAIFKRDDQWTVFVVTEGIADEQTITLGQRNSRFAEVLSGLRVGMQVVMHPNDALSAGDIVTLRN